MSSLLSTWSLAVLLLNNFFPPSSSGPQSQHGQARQPAAPPPPAAKPQQPQQQQQSEWLFKIGDSDFTYRSLAAMLAKKKSLVEKIAEHVKQIQLQPAVSPAAHLKMNVLLIYQRELKAAESSLLTVLRDFNQTLSSNYSSIENIKKNCMLRQEDMRNAAVLVEEDYNTILALEKEMTSLHPNVTALQSHFQIVNEFLSEISKAADTLESELVENLFSDFRNMKGAGLETVVKLSEDSLYEHNMKRLRDQPRQQQGGAGGEQEKEEEEGVVVGMAPGVPRHRRQQSENSRRRRGKGEGGISMLIDSNSNQYILSRPRDVTLSVEDHHFIHDIINLLLLSFLLGSLCSLFKVPSLFGYIFAGMVLGPTGWNLVGSVVQIETLGEVGVIFIVFTVGLEFSFLKLQKVWKVAVCGGNMLLACCILLAILLGAAFQVHPRHSLFVAACLSFSSNPMATRIVDKTSLLKRSWSDLEEQNTRTERESDLNVVEAVGGVLMMQDIQLGFLMALLPFFEDRTVDRTEGGAGKSGPSSSSSQLSSLYWLLQLLQVLFGLPVLVLVVRSLATRLVGRFYRQFSYVLNSENILLGSISLCLAVVLAAEMLSGSLELGCFLAGVVISSRGASETEQVKRLTGPIRDLFAVFFFGSLGFHVYPTFLRSEFTTMGTVTVCIIALKFLLCVVVLGLFIGRCGRSTFVVSVSLAHVSEFSFVLSSRARRMGIISREVYLVILSVTTLSLLLSPLLWRLLLLNRPSSFLRKTFLSTGITFCSSNFFRFFPSSFRQLPE